MAQGGAKHRAFRLSAPVLPLYFEGNAAYMVFGNADLFCLARHDLFFAKGVDSCVLPLCKKKAGNAVQTEYIGVS